MTTSIGYKSGMQRVSYKQRTMVYKCLLMAAPVYLPEMSVPAAASTGRQCLYVQHHMVT